MHVFGLLFIWKEDGVRMCSLGDDLEQASMNPDHYDQGASKELMNPLWQGFIVSFDAL